MNGSGENQLGTRARKASLLDAKIHLRIGTWNVRTMFDTSRTAQVLREMQRVSECRRTGFRHQRVEEREGVHVAHGGGRCWRN